ncbi:MAG TPA: diguanylate cyclase [Sphingobium sp.]
MFPSLTSRIVALGAVIMAALLALVLLLVDASGQTRESFRWVIHSAEVIETMDNALVELRDAESGQRGFVLTHKAVFAESFEQRVAGSRRAVTRVVELTADNPVQSGRARELRSLMEQRTAVLREPLDLARHGRFDEARDAIASGRGRELMATVTLRTQSFLDEERALQAMRVEAAGRRLAWVKQLALIGGPILSVLILLVSVVLIRGIRRPVDVIQEAMTALGRGEEGARVTAAMGSREFVALADGYNAMADQLHAAVADQRRSEGDLQIANDELLRNSETLRDRGEVIELLGGMAHRMQAARTDDELAQVIRVFVPRVLPGIAGALYAHNNSRNLLIPIAGWGGHDPEANGFAPDQCWALRRGQSHYVAEPGGDIVCGHVGDAEQVYHCEPLLAGGEVIGTLYLQGRIEADYRFRLTVMAENIASALVNHRLQRGLREQTIRDPLTGLFNRRYMEETLAVEIARSRRSGAPLSLVMCDVDHFKRFNDEFGHDAGDVVLRAVASEMRSRFRDGDVVCRFGGEEFTIIAPGTTAEALANRVEIVRHAITQISLRHGGRALGTTSMSFGIATWEDSMNVDGSTLIQVADAALYRAKREGRNRAVIENRRAA